MVLQTQLQNLGELLGSVSARATRSQKVFQSPTGVHAVAVCTVLPIEGQVGVE